MSDTLTSNGNLLSPLHWKIQITAPGFKNLEFTITTVTMPGLSMTPVEQPYRGDTPFLPGDKLTWDQLQVRAAANENLENYEEIYYWIRANHHDGAIIESDIVLTLLTSHKNFNRQFRFNRAFPVSLGGWELSTSAEGVEYIQFDVGFRYDTFDLL